MITPSFGLTATERVLPRLALDFTTASLDSRVTFTRALNTATRVNASGLVELVNADVARFDYDPVTLVCKGLLIEESRTNFLIYSDQLDNPAWVTTATSVTANQALSPDGIVSGDKLIEDSTLSNHFITTNSFTPVNATTYTFSVFVKAAERSYAFVGFNAASTPATFVSVNLSAGTIATATGTPVNSSITNAGNGWYRVSVSVTSVATTAAKCEVRISTDGVWANRSYTGDGTSGIYVWGAQIEAGAFPTSYIPTTTTSLTRNADVATMTGTNFSDWFNASEGSIVAEAMGYALSGNIFAFDDNGDNNRIQIARAATSQYQNLIYVGGALQTGGAFGNYTVNTFGKVATAYKVNDIAYVANGGTVGTDNTANIPTVTQLNIGSRKSGTALLNGIIKRLYYYPQRLTNAELQAFSK